jgi:hypothetical protein
MASAEHIRQLELHLPADLALATDTLTLLATMVDIARHTPVEEEANSLAAWLCFRRAVEQLRLAYMAALLGHYSEIGLLVRAVYESAGLGRVLAVEPEDAERWLREGTWHPDSKVRKWIREQRGDDDAGKTYYKQASDRAHTTLASVVVYMPELDDRQQPMANHTFDEGPARDSLRGVVAGGMFAVHCLRNACPDEVVFPVELRQKVVELTGRAGGQTEHLERDWAEEENRRQRLLERVRDSAGLDERLERDPNSLRNLTRLDE